MATGGTFRSQVESVLTQIGTDWKVMSAKIGNLTGLTTNYKTDLVGAINEVRSQLGSAGATNLDGLTDVTITTPVAGHVLRNNGSGQFVNVLGTDFYEVAGAAASAQSAAQSASQPRDATLTSLSGISTTAYGRGLLNLADTTAFTGQVLVASTSVQGRVSLATSAETITGTDSAKATTSAGTKAAIDARISSDGTLGGASASTTIAASQSAVKTYADQIIAAQDAFVYKGTIDASTNPNYPAASAGWTYKISVAGRIGGASGPAVEVGDTVTCLVDNTSAGTQAAVGANWNITQVNIDGAVVGPTSSADNNLASFNGTGGKVVKDSGFSVSTGAVAGNSATVVPTQSAVVVYAQPKSANLTSLAAQSTAANKLPYLTAVDTYGLADFTAFARTLLDDADAATARGTLSVYSQADIGDIATMDLVATYTAAKA